MKDKIMLDKWVVNAIALILVTIFGGIIAVMLALAWNQIVWHSSDSNSYASEFVGILNSVILIGIGVFFSSVIGKMFNIRQEDMSKNIDQSVKVSKSAGLEMTMDKLDKSVDPEN